MPVVLFAESACMSRHSRGTRVPPIPCVSQVPQRLVLTEGVYVKCDARGLCKVTSQADRTVSEYMEKGSWLSAVSMQTQSGRVSRRAVSLVAQGAHPAIVVPHDCTVIVPTVAGVKDLLTEALHTELVNLVAAGSETFDAVHLLRFVQGETVFASAVVQGPFRVCTFARMLGCMP